MLRKHVASVLHVVVPRSVSHSVIPLSCLSIVVFVQIGHDIHVARRQRTWPRLGHGLRMITDFVGVAAQHMVLHCNLMTV